MERKVQRIPVGGGPGSHPKPRSPGGGKSPRPDIPIGPVRSLPTPTELERVVQGEVEEMARQGRPLLGEARARLLEDLKLQYYYGGQPIAYRETDHGKEILAVGMEQMGRLAGELTPEERETVVIGFADPC